MWASRPSVPLFPSLPFPGKQHRDPGLAVTHLLSLWQPDWDPRPACHRKDLLCVTLGSREPSLADRFWSSKKVAGMKKGSIVEP